MATSNDSKSGGANLAGMMYGDPDMWDDRELIRAYDKAVKNWRRSKDEEKKSVEETPGPGPWVEVTEDDQMANADKTDAPPMSSSELLEVGSWIIGAPCRALYSEDGLEYEAKIVGIEGPTCTVRFVGYGNEEKVNLQDLKTTHGKQSRARQRRDAYEYHQNNGKADIEEMNDRFSNVSMTSSMYNNYTESVCRDGDLEDTLTDPRQPLQTSTPRSILFNTASKQTISSLAKLRVAKTGNLTGHSIDTIENATIPSCAEATIDSSSEVSVSSIAEEPQQTQMNLENGDWENFNNTMPQFRFPVPPMPLSLSNKDGGFDFSRGELPSLLMSWYMAGYQAGFFDAKQELTSSNNRNRTHREERVNTSIKSPKRLA